MATIYFKQINHQEQWLVLHMMPTSVTDLLSGLLPSVILIILWLLPALVPVSNLRKRNIEETGKAIWVLIILLLPIIGPVTYFLMNNEKRDAGKR